jgi:hypothetical protein
MTPTEKDSLREDILRFAEPFHHDGATVATLFGQVLPYHPGLAYVAVEGECRAMLTESLLDARASAMNARESIYTLAPKGRAVLREWKLI